MKSFFKIAVTAFKVLSLAVLFFIALGIIAVWCLGRSLPQWAVERIAESLSTQQYAVRIGSVDFHPVHGLAIKGVRVLDRNKSSVAPFLSASQVDVALALTRLPWKWSHMIREITVSDLHFPRLPEGYYIPDSIEFPGSPDFRETNAPVDAVLPTLAPFRLRLVRPDILALRATEVDVASVDVGPKAARFSGIFIQFPDRDVTMSLDGEAMLDLAGQAVRGSVHGQARQGNIRPLLQALEITNSYPFIDGFTGVTVPVDATCRFDVNLINSDLHIFLDLHPTGGAYHAVPFQDAHGFVDIRVFVRDTFQNARIVVGPLAVNFPDGRNMDGTVIYENTNDVGYVTFDARSTTSLSNALAIADILNDGTLDCLQCETPPEITIKGLTAVDTAYAATNDLAGTIGFLRGSFFSVPLRNATTAFRVRGARVDFTDARANAPRGGELTGGGFVAYPGFARDRATFGVHVAGKTLELQDVCDLFGIRLEDPKGKVTGDVRLEGPLAADQLLSHLTGTGHLAVTDANLANLNLFTRLFDAMDKVPGLSSFVRQTRAATGFKLSEAGMSFTLDKGILKTQDVTFGGGFLTITGKGTYDCLKDELDFAVRVKIIKDDTLLGFVKNPILWPFSRLSTVLFGFRATGSVKNPVWRYDLTVH